MAVPARAFLLPLLLVACGLSSTHAFFLHPSSSSSSLRPRPTTTTTSTTALLAFRNDSSSFGPSSFSSFFPSSTGPRITLVGAGPGDPDLLTLAAVRALSTADLVIADRLIPPEMLSLVQGELKIAGKRPGCAEPAQQEIYEWVAQGVQAHKHVVRLKIGDPFLFGRGGEEIMEYRALGVEPQVVPGVSSAFAGPLLASIPVTHRGVANQVYVCTGYGREGDRPYLAPFYPNQTAVFLMAVGRLAELCFNLQQVGYPPTTPVAIVEKASTPRQRTLVGSLTSIVGLAEQEKAAAPAIIVVGEVVHVLLPRPEKEGEGMVVVGGGKEVVGEAMAAYLAGHMTEQEAALFGGKKEEEEKEPVYAVAGRRGGGEEKRAGWRAAVAAVVRSPLSLWRRR